MSHDLKFLVNEINEILGTEFNLISFDSMSPETLLQTLVDVLTYFKATTKFDVKFIDRDDCTKRILESLKKIQYRPNINSSDPSLFFRNISQGDKKTLYPILKYIFENKDKIHQLTYLAQYLLPITLPPEALSNPEIANLWEEYMTLIDKFKETHRSYVEASKETAHLKELRNDINAIELEKDNVKKRIERTQARLDKIPQQELLLEAANVLRIEKERQKEIDAQLEDQKHELNKSKILQERLQKELSNARAATQSTSPQQLMETIEEETQVMEFMVKQKLPNEIKNLEEEIKLITEITDESHISKDYLNNLQNEIDLISKKIQKLVEKRLSERGLQNDALLPFRQQAATVARNKEMAAERLNQATKELREIDMQLQQKQKLLHDTVGEVILKGDELKQYVNTLRAKSSVYKQQRAELAAIKAEVNDLTSTLENLKLQDPSLSTTLQQINEDESINQLSINSRPESPLENRGITELSRIVDGLIRAVKQARDRVTPLSQKIRPLREKLDEMTDERDSKKQTYESVAATLNSEAAMLQSEINKTEMTIKKLENEWQDLKIEYDRAENLLNRVRNEMSNEGDMNISLKESLQSQIYEQEKLYKQLQEEKENLSKNQDYRANQMELWTSINELVEAKLHSLKEIKEKGIGGILSIEKNSQTFTLQ